MKFSLSKNLANVLSLVTVAPVKSFPGVVLFTSNRIAETLKLSIALLILDNPALLIISFGLGSCPR